MIRTTRIFSFFSWLQFFSQSQFRSLKKWKCYASKRKFRFEFRQDENLMHQNIATIFYIEILYTRFQVKCRLRNGVDCWFPTIRLLSEKLDVCVWKIFKIEKKNSKRWTPREILSINLFNKISKKIKKNKIKYYHLQCKMESRLLNHFLI